MTTNRRRDADRIPTVPELPAVKVEEDPNEEYVVRRHGAWHGIDTAVIKEACKEE